MVWFMKDDKFKQPKLSIKAKITFLHYSLTPHVEIWEDIFTGVLRSQMESFMTPIQ